MTQVTGTQLRHAARRTLADRAPWLSVLPAAAWAWWFVVVAPATVALTYAAARFPSTGWERFALLTTAASIAQLTSMRITRRRVFHPAIVFVVTGVLLLSPEQLALMCLLQHFPDWLRQRYSWYVQPFNIANYVLASLAAWTAAHAVGSTLGGSTGTMAVTGVAAASVFVVANRALLAPMLRLARGLSLRATALLDLEDVTLELVLALMAVPLAALWRDGLELALLALAPLTLIHMAQRAMHRLELASGTISAQNEHLEEANRLIVQRSTAALEALSATVDARDTYTAGHSKRVRVYALALSGELALSDAEVEAVGQAALLHDIGKIAVPDSVLLKEGELTAVEWMVMKSHPAEGARIIERLGYLDEVVPAIRHHHERPDGRGYPAGLRGGEIPLVARIIHVADALDSMTTSRVYRAAMSREAAFAEIARARGTDFCSDCVDALMRAAASGALVVEAAARPILRVASL